MRLRPAYAVLLVAGLAACGPETRAQAERNCFEQARLAERPRGEIALGASNRGGLWGGAGVTITSDYLLGRDPQQVWQNCVYRRSGEMPSRPYSDLRY